MATEAVWVVPYWHVDDVGCRHEEPFPKRRVMRERGGTQGHKPRSASHRGRQPTEPPARVSSTLPMPSISPRTVAIIGMLGTALHDSVHTAHSPRFEYAHTHNKNMYTSPHSPLAVWHPPNDDRKSRCTSPH